MPRASLDADEPAGPSQVLRVKISKSARAEAEASLATGESLSAFVRAAIRREVERRKRRAKQ